MSDPRHVVVLGAGMCGLYAARRLAAAGIGVTVLERMNRVGGLAASLERDGVNYDLGVKHFHAHDEEIFNDIKNLMGDELLSVPLRAKIRFGNRFRRYPLKLADLLIGIPPWTILWLFGGLSLQQIKNKVRIVAPENAEQALIQLYGGPLYRYFFRDFTHRYWGIPPAKLSATFVTRKMPRLGAVDLLKQFFGKFGANPYQTDVENALAEETLYYSKEGAIAIPQRIAKLITSSGCRIITSAQVVRVETTVQNVARVDYQVGESEHSVEGDHVISTIPVTNLVELMRPALSEEVVQSARQLRYRPIAVYGMLVNRSKVLDGLYIYYRNRMFHRIAEPSQSGLDTKRTGHAVLLIECTCSVGDDIWNNSAMAKEKLLKDLAAEGVVASTEIVAVHHQRSAYGYPMFDLGFEAHHDRIMSAIQAIPQLDSIGRQGGFCYPNMHETMRQGADVAQRIIASF